LYSTDCAGKDSEAEECFQTALATVETVAGRGHPETAFALGAYASFLKYATAEAATVLEGMQTPVMLSHMLLSCKRFLLPLLQ